MIAGHAMGIESAELNLGRASRGRDHQYHGGESVWRRLSRCE